MVTDISQCSSIVLITSVHAYYLIDWSIVQSCFESFDNAVEDLCVMSAGHRGNTRHRTKAYRFGTESRNSKEEQSFYQFWLDLRKRSIRRNRLSNACTGLCSTWWHSKYVRNFANVSKWVVQIGPNRCSRSATLCIDFVFLQEILRTNNLKP